MPLLMLKAAQGLVPANDEARQWLSKKKLGATVLVEAKELRNPAFHNKWFALATMAFDYWSDAVEPMQYKGEPVRPQFDRFRKDLTISAGFYYPVVNLKHEVRIEAESLKWSSMTEERFTQLYDASINVLLRRVFNGTVCPAWSEAQIRAVTEQVLEFAA